MKPQKILFIKVTMLSVGRNNFITQTTLNSKNVIGKLFGYQKN